MKGRGGFQGGGGMAGIMRQAQQLQLKMKKTQDELAVREYEGTAGGGAVKVRLIGDSQLSSVEIRPDVVQAGDTEMLQDLVLTAVNAALKTAKETQQEELGKVTGGMGIPGLS